MKKICYNPITESNNYMDSLYDKNSNSITFPKCQSNSKSTNKIDHKDMKSDMNNKNSNEKKQVAPSKNDIPPEFSQFSKFSKCSKCSKFSKLNSNLSFNCSGQIPEVSSQILIQNKLNKIQDPKSIVIGENKKDSPVNSQINISENIIDKSFSNKSKNLRNVNQNPVQEKSIKFLNKLHELKELNELNELQYQKFEIDRSSSTDNKKHSIQLLNFNFNFNLKNDFPAHQKGKNNERLSKTI